MLLTIEKPDVAPWCLKKQVSIKAAAMGKQTMCSMPSIRLHSCIKPVCALQGSTLCSAPIGAKNAGNRAISHLAPLAVPSGGMVANDAFISCRAQKSSIPITNVPVNDNLDFFCNHTDPEVLALSQELKTRAAVSLGVKYTSLEQAYAVAAFNWVRDEIKYTILKDWTVPVSYTLEHRHGNCGTKACLLVALLRAAGIEAAFCVERIDTTGTFFFVPHGITSMCNKRSIHFSSAVKLNDQWYHLDVTTDWALATGTSSAVGDNLKVLFDGKSHAIPGGCEGFGKVEEFLPSIDLYMRKTSRIHPQVRECFNLAAEYCRDYGVHYDTAEALSEAAEAHISLRYTSVLAQALSSYSVATGHKASGNSLTTLEA